MSNIKINSGTGPGVAVDLVGTDNYQLVKIVQGASGAGTLSSVLSVTGTVSVGVTSLTATTGTFTISAITTGTVSVVNVLSASGVTVANVATITTLLGTVAVSGGGGGVQYSIGETSMAATGTGTLQLGMQTGATTGRGIAVTTTGAQYVVFPSAQIVTAANITVASITTGTMNVVNVLSASGITVANVATITTLLGTVAVSGGGGGVQYGQDTTAQAATATGTVILGIQSTTTRALALSSTGDPGVRQVGAWNIATVTTLLGTVAVSGGGGGVQYSIGDTSMAATGTGTLQIGMQTGATTGRGIAVTTTGAQFVVFPAAQIVTAANVTVASVTTGTMNVVNVLSASGVTIASVTTGTMNVVNVLSASGVTIASVTTGTVTALLAATTGTIGSIVATAHASRFNAFVMATTSAAGGVIVKTSGAHTLYITDLLIAASGPMNVAVCSETTVLGQVFLATQGGFVSNYTQPLVCTTAQSLRVVISSSGSCAASVIGYTVT